MRVLLHGEGPTDCGVNDGYGSWKEGPIQIIMRKFDSTLQIDCIDKRAFKESRKNHRLQKSLQTVSGHGVFALLLAHIAKENNYDIVAMYRDGDREQGVRPKNAHVCQLRYDKLKSDILTGFENSGCQLRYIAIIPMKMIESWLLADPNSFVLAFGGKLEKLVNEPELTWGDESNPSSSHPKCLMRVVLNHYGKDSCREIFCDLAEKADIEEIARKCPISFSDFYRQMSDIIHS